MSWAETKTINSNPQVPLNKLIATDVQMKYYNKYDEFNEDTVNKNLFPLLFKQNIDDEMIKVRESFTLVHNGSPISTPVKNFIVVNNNIFALFCTNTTLYIQNIKETESTILLDSMNTTISTYVNNMEIVPLNDYEYIVIIMGANTTVNNSAGTSTASRYIHVCKLQFNENGSFEFKTNTKVISRAAETNYPIAFIRNIYIHPGYLKVYTRLSADNSSGTTSTGYIYVDINTLRVGCSSTTGTVDITLGDGTYTGTSILTSELSYGGTDSNKRITTKPNVPYRYINNKLYVLTSENGISTIAEMIWSEPEIKNEGYCDEYMQYKYAIKYINIKDLYYRSIQHYYSSSYITLNQPMYTRFLGTDLITVLPKNITSSSSYPFTCYEDVYKIAIVHNIDQDEPSVEYIAVNNSNEYFIINLFKFISDMSTLNANYITDTNRLSANSNLFGGQILANNFKVSTDKANVTKLVIDYLDLSNGYINAINKLIKSASYKKIMATKDMKLVFDKSTVVDIIGDVTDTDYGCLVNSECMVTLYFTMEANTEEPVTVVY